MKNLFNMIIKSRVFWFFVGVAFLPAIKHLIPYPSGTSPKEAMGNVVYYEEHRSLFTFLGDHSYTLKFPGDRSDFERFAKRLGLDKHKVNDDLYKNENSEKEWIEEVSFHKDDKLKNIHYSSVSW